MFKKIIKTIFITLLLVLVGVIIAGHIKFNVLQDDIYLQEEDGSVSKID